jgi:iron complex outermembrane receptor protein
MIIDARMRALRAVLLATTAASLMPVEMAFAQTAEANGGLEEIVVTSRKREESIQNVAMAVSAFNKDSIENRFANTIADIADVSPNVVIDDTKQGPGGVAAIYIRGVGVADVESSFEPAVGVVVNGIFLGRSSGGITQVLDAERVEVLRGPQGTLFGRNSIGGVINVTRTKPTHELTGKMRASYGNYKTSQFDGYISGGINDKLAVKLNYSYHQQAKGFFYNATTHDNGGKDKYQMAGVELLWNPIENLELDYSFTREEMTQGAQVLLNNGHPGQLFCDVYQFCSPNQSTPISGSRYVTLQNGPTNGTFNSNLHILSAKYTLGDTDTVNYLFGYRNTDETTLQDWDGTPLTLYHTSRPEVYHQSTHELRYTHTGDRLKLVAGLYDFNMAYTLDMESYIGFAVPNQVITIYQMSHQNIRAYAAFFEGDYSLSNKLTVTVGGRYGTDKKDSQITKLASIVQNTPVRAKWSKFTPKVSLNYKPTEDLMFYGLFSTGYRSGGFAGLSSTQTAADTPYAPETVNNYELGMKSQWLDNHLRFNADVFRMDYKNKQEEQNVLVSVGTGVETIVANAATARIWGVEGEFVYVPKEVKGLTLSGNIGYLNAKYINFTADVGRGGVTNNDDLKMRRSPKVTASLDLKYETPIGNGMGWGRVGWHFISPDEVSFLNAPELHNGVQHLIDASLNYDIGKFGFSLYGRNLTKNDAYQIGFTAGGVVPGQSLWSYSAPRNPRTFGFQVDYKL